MNASFLKNHMTKHGINETTTYSCLSDIPTQLTVQQITTIIMNGFTFVKDVVVFGKGFSAFKANVSGGSFINGVVMRIDDD